MTTKRRPAASAATRREKQAPAETATSPSEELAALVQKSKEELLELASSAGLHGVTKLSKGELARRVLSARARSAPPRDVPPEPPAQAREAPQRPAGAGTSGPGTPPAEPIPMAAAAKLDLGGHPSPSKPVEHIPWSYGQDRVTAMAVDPDRLYAYWEVTDPAIERARTGLGTGGAAAWLNLRVYDTSGLIFDGTNAHSYFDHGVSRTDRQWFFAVGKPASSVFVEVGLKSPEGYFVKIARSSRVDFPRKDPAPWAEPEWMTVLQGGETVPAGWGAPQTIGQPGFSPGEAGGPGGPGGQPPGGSAEAQPRFEQVPLRFLLEPGPEGERMLRELLGEAFERVEWREEGGEGWFEVQGRTEWQGAPVVTSWEAGPFSYPVSVEPPSRTEWVGGTVAYTAHGVTHVVYGPWEVVIKNLGGRTEKAVLGRWQVFRSWVARSGTVEERIVTRRSTATSGASEQLGGSARLYRAASEERLGGASELWRLSASEVRLRGASEQLLAGASERRLRGASERLQQGASEVRLQGASERVLGGASERQLQGASERRLQGASERRLQGASEQRLGGASERRLGGSEPRLGK